MPEDRRHEPMEIIGTQQGLSHREKGALVKARLRLFFRSRERAYRLNSREATDTGCRYTDEAVDAGELASALGRCTPRQQRILGLWLGPKGADHRRIARQLGLGASTVRRDAALAIRVMAAQIWDS